MPVLIYMVSKRATRRANANQAKQRILHVP